MDISQDVLEYLTHFLSFRIRKALTARFIVDYLTQPPLRSGGISLLEGQIDHFIKITRLLRVNKFYIDASPTGSGKTAIACALAAHLGLPLFVVCPASAESVWRDMADEYRIPYITIQSYALFRKNPKYFDGSSSTVSDNLKSIINKGALFIVDEAHALSSTESMQTWRVCSMFDVINTTANPSRFGILSATLHQGYERVKTLMRLLGIIKKFRNATNEGAIGDIDELADFCEPVNKKIAKMVRSHKHNIRAYRGRNNKNREYMYETVANDVVMEYYSSAMRPVFDSCINSETHTVRNLMLDLNHQETAIVERSIKSIKNMFEYAKDFSAKMTCHMQKIEKQKMRPLIPIIRQDLVADYRKVIVYLLGIDGINAIWNAFREYNPIIIHGGMAKAKRAQLIREFQTDPTKRIIIGAISIAREAISLDDKIGDQPRVMYASIHWSHYIDAQVAGRIIRKTTKSPAEVNFICSATSASELDVLTAISKMVYSRVITEGGPMLQNEYPIAYATTPSLPASNN